MGMSIELTLTWLFVINSIISITIIILERKSPEKAIAWLLVLVFFPPVGLILYIFLGRNWKRHRLNDEVSPYVKELIYRVIKNIRHEDYIPLVELLANNSNSPLFISNNIEIFKNGREKFDALKRELEGAKNHIHLEYFIVKSDNIGNEIKDILIKKSKEGVKVRFIMDRLGSIRVRKGYFKELKDAGVEVLQYSYFLAPLLRNINTQINYRNHRKIAIIDGKVGFIGGINIGDEYLGNGKLGYWRDTHIMVKGDFVLGLQGLFMEDFKSIKRVNEGYFTYDEGFGNYFPEVDFKGNKLMQLITSGPNSEYPAIMQCILKMIAMAKSHIYITTPYFVPTESIMEALKIAALSGIEVNILFPGRYDHLVVYRASMSYLSEALKCGIKVYLYDKNSFVHSKVITIDGEIATVGTANMDIRSYELNYEANAIIYDKDVTKQLESLFLEDLKVSTELTIEDYEGMSRLSRFIDAWARLFSSLL